MAIAIIEFLFVLINAFCVVENYISGRYKMAIFNAICGTALLMIVILIHLVKK